MTYYDQARDLVEQHIVAGAPRSITVSEIRAVLDRVLDAVSERALRDSPELIGAPTAPTAEIGASSLQIANAAFVAAAIAPLVAAVDIVDDLTSTDAAKPLSANQGRALKALIDVIDGLITDLTASKVDLAGDTITGGLGVVGNLAIGGAATIGGELTVGGIGASSLRIGGDPTYRRALEILTGSLRRWDVGGGVAPESGSDAGTDLEVRRYDDGGDVIDAPLKISRSTGVADFLYSPTVPTPANDDDSGKASSTEFVQYHILRRAEIVNPRAFGDIVLDSQGAASANLTTLRAAIAYGAPRGLPVRLDQIGNSIEAQLFLAGEVRTASGLRLIGSPKLWLCPTQYSTGGAFISNVYSTGDVAERIQSDIHLEGLKIDGQFLPDPEQGMAQNGGSTTTIVLRAEASAVDDAYNNRPLRLQFGAEATATVTITDYNGTTKVATFTPALPGAPDSTTYYTIGPNDNLIGFAQGAANVRITGCHGKNCTAVWASGAGGKFVGAEYGVDGMWVTDCLGEDVTWGYFFQGLDGANANGAAKKIVNVHGSNLTVRRGEVAFQAAGYNTAADPDGDANDMTVQIRGLMSVDCGAMVSKPGNASQKTPVIALAEAQNVSIVDWQDSITSSFAPYPGPANTIAAGLAMPRGQAIKGWGRNILIRGRLHGTFERIWDPDNVSGVGDDAGTTGIPQDVTGIDMELHYHGAALINVMEQSASGGTIAADELKGRLRVICHDSAPAAVLGGNTVAYKGFHVDVEERNANGIRRISGPASLVYARGSNWSVLPFGHTDCEALDRLRRSGERLSRNSANNSGDTDFQSIVSTTIPANSMGPKGFIRVTGQWDIDSNATTKNLVVRLGGQNVFTVSLTTTEAYSFLIDIHNRGVTNSQVTMRSPAASSSGALTSTVDTTVDQTLEIGGYWGAAIASNAIHVDCFSAEIHYGGAYMS